MPIQDAIRLSEQRALTIAQLFKQNGVRENILLYQGAGAAYPIADNSNAEGRKLGNRVEVVAIYHQNDIQGYLNQRYPDIGTHLITHPFKVPRTRLRQAQRLLSR
ncbi:MAG: hypothetical protein IPI14_10525 [Polaromonas sp.]|nr:hypothetical protein [Polaromonas sp.]